MLYFWKIYLFPTKTAKKDVKLERGKIAPVILQISTTPARNKSNEKHCVRVTDAKQTYLRKLFKCAMTETCYTHKWATSALGIALASMWKKRLKQDTNIKVDWYRRSEWELLEGDC